MFLESNMTWTDFISLFALTVSVIVLIVSISFNRKSLNMSKDVLNVSKQQFKELGYAHVIEIVKESKNGYDIFPKLHDFFDSYQGVWIDDEIKKYVNDKSKEIKEFKENSPFSLYQPEYEIEQQEFTDEEIDKFNFEQQQEIENMDQVERHNYEFDQKFNNTKDELLKLLRSNLKDMTKKIN